MGAFVKLAGLLAAVPFLLAESASGRNVNRQRLLAKMQELSSRCALTLPRACEASASRGPATPFMTRERVKDGF